MDEKKKPVNHYQVRFGDGSTALIHADRFDAIRIGVSTDPIFEIQAFVGEELVAHFLNAVGCRIRAPATIHRRWGWPRCLLACPRRLPGRPRASTG